ncbi:DUF4406 domain-containing protein [Bradyrhizobium genosp. L]|uniref:DUF4406 domain-containing protein n=1 Tax=Bradyrhizobium genosp. L TaxID=83637 RepID=UPI0018A31AFB|nr:DUF4406 domain-containing protein [Bradyrhizobium genosp. L]QPF87004.1 DUF4406 domain-containing protein [Bradyrhizobium genosp. L]
MKIYLAGPMTGIPHFNFPAFNAAAALLRNDGHEVFNPAERDIERHDGVDISADNHAGDPAEAVAVHGFSLREALADDTAYICREADAIAMLPGWENSKGARAEHSLAFALGHTIIYLRSGFDV